MRAAAASLPRGYKLSIGIIIVSTKYRRCYELLIPFRSEKKCTRDLHHNSFKTDGYMTKYSCSDHHRGIKHQPEGPLNPLQLSNRPQPRYIPLFQRQKQGARQRAWEGQISTNAVISRHDCRIEFCNLLQSCKPPFVRYENKLQNSIRQSW